MFRCGEPAAKMSDLGKLGRVLHEEHFWTLVVINGLEQRLTGETGQLPLNPDDPEDHEQLVELVSVLEAMLLHHDFEEAVLFPAIAEQGAADMADVFNRDHAIIEPLCVDLRDRALRCLRHGVTAAEWEEFHNAGIYLANQVMIHLQTEEMALIRHLGSLLGEQTDRDLVKRYNNMRRERSGVVDPRTEGASSSVSAA